MSANGLDEERICVIGLGLIGGSVVRALRKIGFRGEIVAGVADADEARRAVELELVEHAEPDIAKAVAGATLIVVAVPIGAMAGVFAAMAPAIEPDAVITDTGSTKAQRDRRCARRPGFAVRTLCAGPPDRGHRAQRAGRRVCRALPGTARNPHAD
jgi:Prephenate dehydrogenase